MPQGIEVTSKIKYLVCKVYQGLRLKKELEKVLKNIGPRF